MGGSKTHTTELYQQKALSFLESVDDEKPWFVYLAYQAVHSPVQADSKYLDPTYGCDDVILPKHNKSTFSETCLTSITDRVTDSYSAAHDPIEMRKMLCAMQAQADEGLGYIQTHLSDTETWDSTLVVFLSDNGGVLSDGSHITPLS